MSATFRCDVCKDPDLNAMYTMYPNSPVRRYTPLGVANSNADYTFGSNGTTATISNQSYDLCEDCRTRHEELIKNFLGRK